MAVATVGSGACGGPGSLGELRAEKRGAYYALAKNPDKYVSYQQAQQQTEDHDDDSDEEDKRYLQSKDDDDEDDDDSEKIIHL